MPPKSGSALAYTEKYLSRLRLCITHGEVELDNNLTENLIRPIPLGRKNFSFLSRKADMRSASLFYSLAQTCKANNINAYEHLSYLITNITRQHNKEQLNQLMPFHPEIVGKFKLHK